MHADKGKEQMKESRRTKIQIYIDILRLMHKSNGRIKRTHIVYKANLTHSRLDEYLDTLISKHFIEEDIEGRNKFYRITDSGVRFLGNVNKLRGIADAFGVPL